jgi:hypothetical protein
MLTLDADVCSHLTLTSTAEAVRIAAAFPVYMATNRRMRNAQTKMMIRDGTEKALIGSAAFTICAPAARSGRKRVLSHCWNSRAVGGDFQRLLKQDSLRAQRYVVPISLTIGFP